MKRLSVVSFVLIAAAVHGADCACASKRIECQGEYSGHLQGVATDGNAIYWSFTRQIVKTDLAGRRLISRSAPSHQGDLCVKDGVVYVAVNLGRFNHVTGAVSKVMSYDAATLKPAAVWDLPDMPHGAGGMTFRGGHFFVVGGLPATYERNYVYEYTGDFRLVKRHELDTGFTLMGIQTAAYENGRFFFGIYGGKGNPGGVLAVENDLRTFSRYTCPGAVGILRLNGAYYTAGTPRGSKDGLYKGYIERVPDFCTERFVYNPARNGGEVRIFFAGQDKRGWIDSGYELRANGYWPLTQFDAAFRPVGGPVSGEVKAVLVSPVRRYSAPDLVRGVRRAAEQNESLAIGFAGTAEEVAADGPLSRALDSVRREAERLGVAVRGL